MSFRCQRRATSFCAVPCEIQKIRFVIKKYTQTVMSVTHALESLYGLNSSKFGKVWRNITRHTFFFNFPSPLRKLAVIMALILIYLIRRALMLNSCTKSFKLCQSQISVFFPLFSFKKCSLQNYLQNIVIRGPFNK